MTTRTRPAWLAPAAGVLVGAAIAAAIFAPHSSTVRTVGPMTVQTRAVPAFRGVDLSGANLVTVSLGSKRLVQVRGNRDLVDNVTTEVSGGVLRIGTKGSTNAHGSMHVTVVVPVLESLTIDGSGMIVAEGLRSKQLVVRLPGSGVIRARGQAGRLDVSLAGSGDAQLGDLSARDVRAVLEGRGRIVVNATHSLDASVPGSGAIMYGGDPPVLRTSVTGTGAIQPG
jgi:hypothetical protein